MKTISKQYEVGRASLLTKLKETKQRGKGMIDRWNQVQGAYSSNPDCTGKAVPNVDDVLRSRASLSECVSILTGKRGSHDFWARC